jgi:hypothetical protein
MCALSQCVGWHSHVQMSVKREVSAVSICSPPYLYASKGLLSMPAARPLSHVASAADISLSVGGEVFSHADPWCSCRSWARVVSRLVMAAKRWELKPCSAKQSLEICSRDSCHLCAALAADKSDIMDNPKGLAGKDAFLDAFSHKLILVQPVGLYN